MLRQRTHALLVVGECADRAGLPDVVHPDRFVIAPRDHLHACAEVAAGRQADTVLHEALLGSSLTAVTAQPQQLAVQLAGRPTRQHLR